MKEEWLMSGAVVPVDVETTAALVAEIRRLIDVVGGMALAQPVQVTHTVIAGALFDFMGYLTSRKERIVLSAADDAAPAADAIRDFATKRGLSLDDAQVREWIDALAQPEERNFCPRCGKRTADLITIHTCTPPIAAGSQAFYGFPNGSVSTPNAGGKCVTAGETAPVKEIDPNQWAFDRGLEST